MVQALGERNQPLRPNIVRKEPEGETISPRPPFTTYKVVSRRGEFKKRKEKKEKEEKHLRYNICGFKIIQNVNSILFKRRKFS